MTTADAIAKARENIVNEYKSQISRDFAWEVIEDFLLALSATQVIVPREPTEEMEDAADRLSCCINEEGECNPGYTIWEAMIAAAIAPKQGEK